MPMLDEATTIMSMKFSAANVGQTAAQAQLFSALPLPAGFVYPNDAVRRRLLQAYLNGLPLGIQESMRAAIYFALTSRPPRPMTFRWAGAYDYALEHTETFDTYYSPRTPGVMGLTLHGRYPDDPHPLADRMTPRSRGKARKAGKRAAQSGRGGSASVSRRTAKGAPKPARRRPSKRS